MSKKPIKTARTGLAAALAVAIVAVEQLGSQQGAMLQWMPGDGNETKAIYNKSKDGHFISVICDIESGEKRGMIIDFSDLKKAVRALADSFDHTLIFERGSLKPATLAALRDEGFSLTEVDFRPTAENFARHFADILAADGLPVRSVTVYETPTNCATYEV